MARNILEYAVTTSGIICDIAGPWEEFARSNGGKSLQRDDVLGTSIYKYIRGDGVRAVYKDMHQQVMQFGRGKINFDYRCDAPEMKRFMSMELSGSGDTIRYVSEILREELNPEPVHIDYESRRGPLVLMCAWCKNFRYPQSDEIWRPVETIFLHVPETFTVSHGMCPDCVERHHRTKG